jgi:3-phenylpropionate/trans-cinnamate dioxygenase ferredoxin reductase subunit
VSAGTLIVGACQAGVQLATSLRQLDPDHLVTLVGSEAGQPYQRPPLSKEFLSGEVEADSLAFRAEAFYDQARIDLICGDRVTRIRLPDGRHPGTATTDSGRELDFDQLALTVGARPRRLDLPGSELDGVCYLRDLRHATDFRRRLATARRVIVVGGGFIGLEAAAVARLHGKDVTVVEAADRLIARAVAPVVSQFYLQAHRRRGTTVELNAAAAAITGDQGLVTGLALTDGRHLEADLVLIGVGVVPRTELAEQIGLDCDGGIVVDIAARTSHPRVVAAGDCTVQPHPLTGLGRVRIESVPNAVAQAKAAASTLLGRPAGKPAVPWFWSDQADLKLQIAGLSTGYDQVVVRGDPTTERFSAVYYQGGRLLAADAVNQPADYVAVRKALSIGATIPPDLAADPTSPLKTLITPGTELAGTRGSGETSALEAASARPRAADAVRDVR